MLARVAQRYYKFPDRDVSVVGVTGTNGKTTVSYLIRHLLNESERIGLLGTISYDLGARTVPSFRTTPESVDIFGMLAQMRDAGCRHAVMEVSSHGIAQQRVLGLQFDAAVFTNLTRDHLDFHKTLESYFDVKTRLFTGGARPRAPRGRRQPRRPLWREARGEDRRRGAVDAGSSRSGRIRARTSARRTSSSTSGTRRSGWSGPEGQPPSARR